MEQQNQIFNNKFLEDEEVSHFFNLFSENNGSMPFEMQKTIELIFNGVPQVEAAKVLGITPETISQRLTQYLYKRVNFLPDFSNEGNTRGKLGKLVKAIKLNYKSTQETKVIERENRLLRQENNIENTDQITFSTHLKIIRRSVKELIKEIKIYEDEHITLIETLVRVNLFQFVLDSKTNPLKVAEYLLEEKASNKTDEAYNCILLFAIAYFKHYNSLSIFGELDKPIDLNLRNEIKINI